MNLTPYIPFCLAMIMFSMGLSLQWIDFKRLLDTPKAIMLGLGCQIILLPVLAWLVAWLTDLGPILTAGLILIALCPGGVTSNLACHLARGNSALSISLTALSSVITVFSLPLVFTVLASNTAVLDQSFALPLLATVQKLASLTLLPVAAGMLLRHFFPIWVVRLQGKITAIAALSFCLVIGSVWYQQWDNIYYSAALTAAAVLLLNGSSLFTGWGMAKLLGLDQRDRITISLEVGLQNSALAVVVAITMIGNAELAIPATVYSVVMICSAICAIIISRWSLRSNTNP